MVMSRAFVTMGCRAAAQLPRRAAFAARQPAAVVSRRWMSSQHFLESHEYIKVDGNTGTVGISDFAQQALGDVVFVELPEVGDSFEKGETFGSVESVKAASDVYAPASGEVIEINSELADNPSLVNESPMDGGWFIKLKLSDKSETDALMGPDAYKKFCDDSKH